MFHLNVGDKAPSISANDQSGNTIELAHFLGKKVVLYFYPKDDTPGCTAEACSFRDAHESLLEKGLIVLGVSPDSEKSHTKFVEKYSLPFSLLADTDKKISNDYGVWGKKKFMGREYDGIHRTTFIINETGVIEKIINKVDTKDSTTQVLNELGL